MKKAVLSLHAKVNNEIEFFYFELIFHPSYNPEIFNDDDNDPGHYIHIYLVE